MTQNHPNRLTTSRRVKALTEIERLNNWRTASRRSAPEFAARNKTDLDRLLRGLADIVRKPPRRAPRTWATLHPTIKAKFIRKIERRTAVLLTQSREHQATLLAQAWRIVMPRDTTGLIANYDIRKLRSATTNNAARYNGAASFNSRFFAPYYAERRVNPDDHPTDRLQALRDGCAINLVRQSKPTGSSAWKITHEFITDLHPDDAELSVSNTTVDNDGSVLERPLTNCNLVCDRLLRTYRKTIHDQAIAASLYLTDPSIQVWYCALVVPKRKAMPELERWYLVKINDPVLQEWRTLGVWYKSPANALKAGQREFSVRIADLLHQEKAIL